MSNALAQTPPPYNGLDPVPIENYPQHAPFDGTFFFYYAADDCSNGKLIMIKVAVPPTGPGGDPKLPTDPVVLDEPEEPEDGDSNYILRVFVELGARLKDESSDQEHAVEIEAEFVAEYNMAKMLSKECVDEFALKNASFHIWPYWREFLMSQCMRLGMSKIAVPTFQVAANQNQ